MYISVPWYMYGHHMYVCITEDIGLLELELQAAVSKNNKEY